MQELLKKALNPYTIFARYLPALVSALPLLVIWYYMSAKFQLDGLASFILNAKVPEAGEITFSLAILHFYSLLIREISKYFQRHYFTGDRAKGFPTTYLMTYSDSTFSDSYKDKYRELISKQFNIELLNKEDERGNITEARKRLNEATELVKAEMQNVYLVLKHNIWFGSLRNLIGGIITSMLFCIVGILLGLFLIDSNEVMIFILVLLFFFYLLVFLFRRPILVHNGEAYAQKLFAEFIKAHT